MKMRVEILAFLYLLFQIEHLSAHVSKKIKDEQGEVNLRNNLDQKIQISKISSWNKYEVAEWLESSDLGGYKESFRNIFVYIYMVT